MLLYGMNSSKPATEDVILILCGVQERCYGYILRLRMQHGISRFADGARLAPREFAIEAR